MIKFDDVHYSYPSGPDGSGGKNVLNGVSFELTQGDHTSLMGLSGCGKSTIVSLACGFLKPQQGKITIMGKDLADISIDEKKQLYQNLGVSFQQGGLFQEMLVKENLCFAMEKMRGWTVEEQNRRVEHFLRGMNLEHAASKYPHELSGGMRRRVALARALCTDPLLAILDNPTAGLDPISSHQILSMIRSLSKKPQKRTILCLTSHVEMGITFASQVILLNKGVIVANDNWTHLVESQQQSSPWVKDFLTIEFKGCSEQKLKKLGFPNSFIKRRRQQQHMLN